MQTCHRAVFKHRGQMQSYHSAVFKLKWTDTYMSQRSIRAQWTDAKELCHSAGSSKRVVSEGELLTSTWEHRLITGGSMLLMFSLFGKGLSEISTPTEAMTGVAAFLFAYGLSGKPL